MPKAVLFSSISRFVFKLHFEISKVQLFDTTDSISHYLKLFDIL